MYLSVKLVNESLKMICKCSLFQCNFAKEKIIEYFYGMEDIKMILTAEDYNKYVGAETMHPLVSVVDMSQVKPMYFQKAYYGMYCIFLKNVNCGPLRYGNKYYDYQDGTIVAMAPGQAYGVESEEPVSPSGWSLVFHPDFIHGTDLGRVIKDYTFFLYDNDEALHISQRERNEIENCFKTIKSELEKPIDKHTQRVVCRQIGLLLDYCLRFYDRQFITRHSANSNLLTSFEEKLNEYIQGPLIRKQGTPSVAYFASELCLSANYFGDLIKKELGMSPKDYMMQKLIDIAKEKLLSSDDSISKIGESLGFEYANHFTRLFKKHTNMSPSEYRNKHLS
jgi:AraC-like DNA-binding protein